MARNKHPEETINLILDVSARLFSEKGYEKTSIQDIINELGGLSKGAIYHHFKSKEAIFDAFTDRMQAGSNQRLKEIRNRKDLTGKEKLRLLFKMSLGEPIQNEIFATAPRMKESPELVFRCLRGTVDEVAPEYLLPIIKQGMEDGSIQAEYPEELAELIMLASNFWMNPMIFDDTPDRVFRKFYVLDQMLRGFGLDIVDQAEVKRLMELAEIYQKNKQKSYQEKKARA